jgi:hypothetical protein
LPDPPVDAARIAHGGPQRSCRSRKWVSDERDIYADYKEHIGGRAKSVVRVWLLGVSLFQRRAGSCRFGDMQISQPGASTLKL